MHCDALHWLRSATAATGRAAADRWEQSNREKRAVGNKQKDTALVDYTC